MGIQDRDYYREHHRKQSKSEQADWYQPKLFRRKPDAHRAANPPDLPGANWPWWAQFAVLVILVLAVYGAYKLVQPAAPPPSATGQRAAPAPSVQPSRPVPDPELIQKAQRAAEAEKIRQQRERAQLAEESRRKAAWATYFKPSPSCQRDAGTVDCANEYIRARREFDSTYK